MRTFDNIIILGENIPLDLSTKIERTVQALILEGRHAVIVTNLHDLTMLVSIGKIQSYTRIDIVAHGTRVSDMLNEAHYLSIPEGDSLSITRQKNVKPQKRFLLPLPILIFLMKTGMAFKFTYGVVIVEYLKNIKIYYQKARLYFCIQNHTYLFNSPRLKHVLSLRSIGGLIHLLNTCMS